MLVNASAAIHNELRDTDRAVALLRRVLEAKPDSTVAKVNLTNFTASNHQTAIKTLVALEEQNPPDVFTVQAAIGDHAFDMEDWTTAQLYYRRVISRPLPFAYLLERVYKRAAQCEERIIRGEAGRTAALTLALEGIERFPESELLKSFLTELAK